MTNEDRVINEFESGVELLLTTEKAAREYVQVKSLKMSTWIGLSEKLHELQEEKFEKLCDALEALDEWRKL